ncbi:MAG TPA: hypothetical protein VGD14_09525 [bacterium]
MIKIDVFKGEIPKISDKLLPDGYATTAINCDLKEGSLKPIKGATSVQDIEAGAQTIYRLGEQWLQWGNKINVIESLIYESGGRILFTGDNYPKETNLQLALVSSPFPTNTRRLGISAPAAAMSTSITVAGSGTDRNIAYCYTRVGLWEDGTVVESAPSPATAIFVAKTDATVRLTDFVDATETGVFTTHYRIYRINTGDTGAEYQFVDDLDKTDSPLQYDDSIMDENLGEVLPTDGWTAPIGNLKGILPGSNGLIFGFNDNTVYVTETFITYTFPDRYKISVASEIVGLGFNGSAIVVLTKTVPFLIYGSEPESLSVDRRPFVLPCKSERSIISVLDGVIFSSPPGLAMIDSGGNARILTEGVFTKEQWEALGPEKVFSFYYNDAYVAFFEGTNQGIEIKTGTNEIRRFETDSPVYGGQYVSTVSINTYDLLDSDSKNFLTSDGYQFLVTGSPYSLTYDTLYLIQETELAREIVAWESGSIVDYEWKSKEYWTGSVVALTCGRVVGDFSNGSVVFQLYIDDALHFSKTVSNDSPFRIAGPIRGNQFHVMLIGKATVEKIMIGSSMSEVVNV